MCTSGYQAHRVRGQRYSGLEACKIEKDIESFVESFKKKGSDLDNPSLLERPPSLESFSSSLSCTSRLSSSLYSSDLTDDSPEKSGYLMPEIVRRYRYCSTTTSDSEAGEEDFRRLLLAYKDSKRHSHIETGNKRNSATSSSTDGPDGYTGDGMGMEACPYSVIDVAQHLQSKFAFISGTKAKNSAPIMTFPDRPNIPEPSEEDYRKVVTYLCSIPQLAEKQMGFVLLVDRRQSGWSSVKTILKRFSNFFPCHIQVVFLLQPHGFFQRAFSDYKSKFKEELEYKVISMDTPEGMFEYINPSSMTIDMGGTLEFDAKEWTQNRSAAEKFSSNIDKMELTLATLLRKFENSSTPNDVVNTEKQILEHSVQRKELLEDLESSVEYGQTLLNCIKGDNESTALVQLVHVQEIERLLVQIEETRKQFEGYWERHSRKLNQSLQLRKFEEDFKMFQYNNERKMDLLESKMKEVGDSVKKVEELVQEFNEFDGTAKKEIEQGERMRENGEHYIINDHYAVDSIRPKCLELQRICDQYKQLLRKRQEILTKSQDLHERIDKANKWCAAGVNMLTNLQLQGYSATNGIAKAVEDIDNFVATVKELKLNNPKEFRQLFDSVITSDTRATVQKTLKRIDDVQSMCAIRKADLLAQTQSQPIQHPFQSEVVTSSSRGQSTVPVYNLQKKHRGQRTRDRKEDKGQDLGAVNTCVEKSARIRVDIGSTQPQRSTLIHHGSTSTCSSMSTADSTDGVRNSIASTSTASASSSLSEHLQDSLHEKRKHVLNELIESEKMYVEQLKDIIEGYYKEMDSRTMQHLISKELLNKKDILFGNLEQIFKFHNDVFLKDLQSCMECPTKLGKCFVNRKEEFQMYSIYCQNKPRSEELQTLVGDQHPFFKECQNRLQHKLPLGAFLLKPVQRITKYQLLLKEMLKYTKDDKTCQHQLEEAHNTMLEVLRIVNNSMYEVSIVGFKGLSELGKLLMQGNFNVWTEHKHEKIRDIRFKPMQRHLFLYEKAILMCKKKEDAQNADNDVFSFKNILRCNHVGLTENIKGDKHKFELWLRGREEVYIVQAPSMEVKEFWVKEIKKVLMGQFDEIKFNKLNLNQRSSEDLTRSGSDSGMESWRHRQGSGNNSNSTVPIGIAMMSPESPPKLEEEDRWSDVEYTDSEPEENRQPNHYPSSLEPSYLQQFVAIADYRPIDDVEMGLRAGDVVEILRTGSTGWWLAHHLNTNEEGWVPSTYLDPVPNNGSRSLVSVSSMGSQPSQSSMTSGYSATSPIGESSI